MNCGMARSSRWASTSQHNVAQDRAISTPRCRFFASAPGLDEVPAIAEDVLENHDVAIRFVPDWLDEAHAVCGEPRVIGGIIRGFEEKGDAAASPFSSKPRILP